MADPVPVLLVEDHPALLALYELVLDGPEFCVIAATSVVEARTAIELAPDLCAVVTDYILPDGTGTEIIDQVRERFPDAGVVVITGFPDWPRRDDVDLSVQMLSKPHELRALADAVRVAVAPSRSNGSGPASTDDPGRDAAAP